MAKSRLHQLSELGQSVWIDCLSRQLIQSGNLALEIAPALLAVGPGEMYLRRSPLQPAQDSWFH